jgi:hypothetical protein
MKIRIINKGNRNQLVCEKKDGGFEVADLGPNLPFHDIAHFIVESQLKLRAGFYGNIFRGYTIKQLSDKEIIKTLPLESAVAEVVTGALQPLSSGACTPEQFMVMINEEFELYSIDFPLNLDQVTINQMLLAYRNILSQWHQLKEGESLELNLELPG